MWQRETSRPSWCGSKVGEKKLHMTADTDIIKETGEELFWRQAPELR